MAGVFDKHSYLQQKVATW